MMMRIWEWIRGNYKLLKTEEWEEIKTNSDRYLKQYRPEGVIHLDRQLKSMDEEVLLAIYKEFSSTKNALLLEQKKYTDPIQIAYRD